jgi:hypothetical protein
MNLGGVLRVVDGRKRPGNLSITHNFSASTHAEDDVGEPGESSLDDGVAWRRVGFARQVAAKFGQLGEISR